MLNYKKYKKNPVVHYPEREWPNKEIEKAPVWCSVDLRDGNQALIDPMVVSEKMEMFRLLVKLGFKEIEIGFPAASQIEYDFLRALVDNDMIPDDVYVQVLSQCRKEQIERTFESIKGIKNVIFHIYNSTSTLQRDVVFNMDREGIIEIAKNGTRWVKEGMKNYDGNLVLEYSPESFTGTELDFALDICTAVQDIWEPTKEKPMIFNLPSTVVHPHNDRGCGVAAAELALLAGAQRIEGTLLGNGERTGNVDLLNIAYNMFTQGINPELDIEDINEIIDVYERCNKMSIDERHPYAGKLVFTAFSGSHQDAINKGIAAMKERKSEIWEVPYLPIDPSDIGRVYEPIIRVNSQSGKGGVAFIMSTYFGFKLPKGMHAEFAKVVQAISEKVGEVPPDDIMEAFRKEYLYRNEPLHFRKLQVADLSSDVKTSFDTRVRVDYSNHGVPEFFEAFGNGPLDALQRGFREKFGFNVRILDYEEHALQSGSDSQAAAYIHLLDSDTGKVTYGVGVSSNITRASVRAVFSGINRLGLGERQQGIADHY